MFKIVLKFVFLFLTKYDVIYQYKRIINDEKIEAFLQNLYQYD